jgi:hypothetical protein
MTIKEARKLLEAANVFFGDFEDGDDKLKQTINMNDVWGWAVADGQYVKDEELPEVANMFSRYGWCGILYWASKKRGNQKSEFHDVNRFIQFVEKEEEIKMRFPNPSDRAYKKEDYHIG